MEYNSKLKDIFRVLIIAIPATVLPMIIGWNRNYAAILGISIGVLAQNLIKPRLPAKIGLPLSLAAGICIAVVSYLLFRN